MTDYDEKTHVWILRTQAISRTPAVRGGVTVDRLGRRQTLASVAGAMLVLFLLCMAPSLPRPAGQPDAARPANVIPSAAAVQPSAPVHPGVTEGYPALLEDGAGRMPDQRPANPATSALPPLPGHVPPPAPVWLDHPGVPSR